MTNTNTMIHIKIYGHTHMVVGILFTGQQVFIGKNRRKGD